eukprot:scaffold89910_cov26-Tisochrysis_lutea.AAC.3
MITRPRRHRDGMDRCGAVVSRWATTLAHCSRHDVRRARELAARRWPCCAPSRPPRAWRASMRPRREVPASGSSTLPGRRRRAENSPREQARGWPRVLLWRGCVSPQRRLRVLARRDRARASARALPRTCASSTREGARRGRPGFPRVPLGLSPATTAHPRDPRWPEPRALRPRLADLRWRPAVPPRAGAAGLRAYDVRCLWEWHRRPTCPRLLMREYPSPTE